ncbi:MAG: acetylornithine/N-succinyldiaminopimelate aminotransferase [Solirubrobacteraceae bacterium]|jgi:acetylornithine/N-succinyldiaminopimelate aminotransferase|nr:acetylornithine/N-succinyldiaminopimelate aminotransferase [Solirubrobacteraceae bacterium]
MRVDFGDTALLGNYARYPVEFVSGRGSTLVDAAGDEYLDLLAGIAVCNTGHCHPRVVAAVQEQAARLMHVSNLFFTSGNVRLAARLSAASLGGKVFFCNSGAEANEAALKLARKRRRGGGFLVAHGGFHGRTYGALSATPQEAKQAPFGPLVPGFTALPADAIAGAVTEQTAAVVLEVVQGESGVNPIAHDELRRIREACTAQGALLILDEVQTGMGRTGTLWAYQQTGVTPDVITIAKGLGGGFPIGALVTTPELADVFEPGDHGSTFAGNPLASAAANAALDVLDDPDLLAAVRDRGEHLQEGLRELPGIRSVRGVGLMVAAELADELAPDVARRALLEQRLIINATGPGTLRFVPPLVITESEIDEALGRLGALLSQRA